MVGHPQILVVFLFLCAVPQLTKAKCSEDQYFDLIKCIGDDIQADWNQLLKQPDSKIKSEEKLIAKCFKEGKCEDELDFDKDFVDLLPKSIRNLAKSVRDFWDSLSYLMKKCVLSSARDSLLGDVEKCVQKEGQKDFVFPKKFPNFPMPDKKLESKELKDKMLKRIYDKINAFLSTQKCDSPKSIRNCFENDTTTIVKKCFKNQLCNEKPCKQSLPKICAAVDKCIPQLTSNLVKQMSSLDDLSQADQNKYLDIMDKCEKSAKADNPDYLYSRVAAAKILHALDQWKANSSKDKQVDSFKLFLEQMVNSYFDISSVCRQSC